MLSAEKISENKSRFLGLVDSLTREGINKELLIKQLCESDFFTAPASTKYHGCYEGGLCEHSLNVYDNLCSLLESFNFEFDKDSVKIVSLFHDLAKMNFYVIDYKNKKTYSQNGSKRDNNGRYDWESVPMYTVKQLQDRFILGSHESTCAYMASYFIPLTVEEYVAILHHHGGQGWDSAKDNIADIFSAYPLALLLHQADCLDAYGYTEYGVVNKK